MVKPRGDPDSSLQNVLVGSGSFGLMNEEWERTPLSNYELSAGQFECDSHLLFQPIISSTRSALG